MSNDKPHTNHYFVDNKKYDTEKPSLTGAEIKAQASVEANYQLFLEAHGNDPDQMISDGHSLAISTPPLHFYAVPPATFGSK